jgi:hypothetical protein
MLPVRCALPISCVFLACLLMPVEGSAQAIPLERRAVESEEEPAAKKSPLKESPDSAKPSPALTERSVAEGSKPLSGPPLGTPGSKALRRKADDEGTGVGPLPGIPSGVTSIPKVSCTYRAWVEGLPMGEFGGSGEMEYRMEITIANASNTGIRVDVVCGLVVEVNGIQDILDCEKPKDLVVQSLRVQTLGSDCGRREGVSSTGILLHNAYLRDTFDPIEVTECRYEP